MNEAFKDIKNNIIDLIKQKKEVSRNTDYKNGGIYLLYIDNFNSDKIIPVYIGKTHNFQERHKEHIKEILSINRLTKKYYTTAIINKYYEGYYKSCKMFKFLVDNDCSLKDIHMLILEECDDEEKRINLEYNYINKYLTSFFGFNQLNTISLQQDYARKGPLSDKYLDCVESDIINIDKFFNYGFNHFNFQLAHGLFERHKNKSSEKSSNLLKFNDLTNMMKNKEKFVAERRKAINYINYTSIEECHFICDEIINNFFESNGLKSEDKKKDIVKCLLFQNEKMMEDVNKYIQRFAINKEENIFEKILKTKIEEISMIKSKINKYQEKYKDNNEKINNLLLLIYKDIIPEKEYNSYPLRDNYVLRDYNNLDKDNVLYFNVEVSNHGRRQMSDDFPCILKVDYIFKDNDKSINKEYYIKSSFDNFFENGDEYYINNNMYNIGMNPFNLRKYSETRNYDTISTSMEYYNGINEITLVGKEKYKFVDIIKEIDCIINENTKVVFTSGNKNFLRKYKEILPESLIFNKIHFQNRDVESKKIYFKKHSNNEVENLKYELCKMIKKDECFKSCKNKELRVEYIKKLLTEKLDDKYLILKNLWLSNTPNVVYKDAINFINLVWKEYKGE